MSAPLLQERPITVREALIPYAMAGINMLAATTAARGMIMPLVLLVSIALILAGLPCSIYFRQRRYNRILLNMLVGIPLLLFAWTLVRTHPGLQLDWANPLDPLSAMGLEQLDEAVLNLVIIVAAGRAFLLLTPRDVLWTPLPSISIILLAVVAGGPGASLIDMRPMLITMLLLFATSLYLFSHEHSQLWLSIHTPIRVQRQLIVWMVACSLLLFPIVIILGWLMQPINMVTLASRRPRRDNPLYQLSLQLNRRTGISLSPAIDMDGANWPRGKRRIMTVQVPQDAAGYSLLWRAGTYAQYSRGEWGVELLPLRRHDPNGYRGRERHRRDQTSWRHTNDSSGWEVHRIGQSYRLAIDPLGQNSDPGIIQALQERALSPEAASVTQTIRIYAPAYDYLIPLYAAFQPIAITSTDSILPMAMVGRNGAIAFNHPGTDNPLTTYEAVSLIKPTPTNLTLTANPQLSPEERNRYLQMPGGNYYDDQQLDGDFAKRIRFKARTILKQHPESSHMRTLSDIDTVTLFEQYLNRNYRYTLTPKPVPGQDDPIINFLYYGKQGYCNHFSGSMVMLCRSVGIPARFVAGFATGDMQEETADTEFVTYDVTEKHAHSWAEVYLDHYGWYTVDPTAGSEEVPTLMGGIWDAFSHTLATTRNMVSTWLALLRQDPRLRAYLYLALAACLALSALVLHLKRERPPTLPGRPLPADEARRTVRLAYHRMHRWMRMWGVVKPPGATAQEFNTLFADINAPMADVVSGLTGLYLRAQYGVQPITDAEARDAVMLLHRLWELARVERKHLHHLDMEN